MFLFKCHLCLNLNRKCKKFIRQKLNCTWRLDSAEFLISCSFCLLSLSREQTFGAPRFFPPFFALALSFSQHFLAQNYSFPASSLDYNHGKAPLSGSLNVRYQEDLFSTVCFLLCAISTLAVVPGEIPALAGVEDGSSGGDHLRRGKGEGKTCVVSAAFTLAETNGCKTGARVQPSEFWKISKAAWAKEEHLVVVCGSDTSRKITFSCAPDYLTAMRRGPALSQVKCKRFKEAGLFSPPLLPY